MGTLDAPRRILLRAAIPGELIARLFIVLLHVGNTVLHWEKAALKTMHAILGSVQD